MSMAMRRALSTLAGAASTCSSKSMMRPLARPQLVAVPRASMSIWQTVQGKLNDRQAVKEGE